jgi:hypothetical protein
MLDNLMGGNIQPKKIDRKTIEVSLIWIKRLSRISVFSTGHSLVSAIGT